MDNPTKPEWLLAIENLARPAMVAFKKTGMPLTFLYMNHDDDWFDWPDIFGIPVCNVDFWWPVAGDEDVPLLPVWQGELTDHRRAAQREFQCRYAQTGDF